MHNVRKKTVRLLFVSLVLIAMFALTAHAQVPGKPKLKLAGTTATTVKLKWNSMSNITGYKLYKLDEGNERELLATISAGKKACTLKNLTAGTTYSFILTAYNAEGEGVASNPVKTTPTMKGLEQIKTVIVTNGKAYVKLRYYKNVDADGYVIYQKNKDNDEYTVIGKSKNLSYKVNNLTAGEVYYFKVSTYKKVGRKTLYGVPSEAVIGRPGKKSKEASLVHSFYYEGKMNSDYTVNGVTFKQGQKVTVTKKSGAYCKVLLNKKEYKIPKNRITIVDFVTDYKAKYSASEAEAFVNGKGYVSGTKYLLWISGYTQHIYVFKGSQYNWKLVKTFICSTGMYGWDEENNKSNSTPTGKCFLGRKQEEFWWTGDQVAYWCSMIRGGFIHSWLYHPDGSKYPGVGEIGVPSSHGCVRTKDIASAKWIYDKVPTNTTVVTY